MMNAFVVDTAANQGGLVELPTPAPAAGELLVRVLACGLCRTDLHILDGEVRSPRAHVVPGHQIVGEVVPDGRRVCVAWIAGACGKCGACTSGRENLCAQARFTGLDRDGGFAEYVTVDERFALPCPPGLAPEAAAPLLCAGAIGWRALRLAGDAARLGLFGFGAAAHLVTQVARWQGRRVFAFTRPGDQARQEFARALGAEWAGGTDTRAPEPLDAAILFAPSGELVPLALAAVGPGGTVVCAEIHMTDLPGLPYALLWGERVLRSVANVTRQDVQELLEVAQQGGVRAQVTCYPLTDAARAFADLRGGRLRGAAVIVPAAD